MPPPPLRWVLLDYYDRGPRAGFHSEVRSRRRCLSEAVNDPLLAPYTRLTTAITQRSDVRDMNRAQKPHLSPKETSSQTRTRTARVIERLKAAYPDARCSLIYTNPLELLVATVLSAQCTDARVNIVTKSLFKKYQTARDYAAAPLGELEEDIKPTGFYRNKAKALRACCAELMAQYEGEVPSDMAALVRLPGIGRKTANVILGNAFDVAAGIVVDTHVRRLAGRLGLSRHSDPDKIEQDLLRVVPRGDWILFSHLLILHGRRICSARAPKCPVCLINDLCPSAKLPS
jgi:endonuclease III